MKHFPVPRTRGGSVSKMGGIFTPSSTSGKGVGKTIYKSQVDENVASMPVQAQPQIDMSKLAQVLAQTSIAKRGGTRKVRL